MSRIHDALKKAGAEGPPVPASVSRKPVSPRVEAPEAAEDTLPDLPVSTRQQAVLVDEADLDDLEQVIQNATVVPYAPQADALLVDPINPRAAPAEEFRTLRTRLNHLQTLQPLHTLVVTSASPAEGKSFTATNLAITQSQLADKRILLADFDFRRPNINKTFQLDCAPGLTDYLLGNASLEDILRRIGGTNLYVLTAGEAVPNPLELLNLKECRSL